MNKYHSLLFGNGLSIGMLNKIQNESNNRISKYLNLNVFITDFINSEKHNKIYRDFLKYFQLNNEASKYHEEARRDLKNNLDDILKFGFERWVSKNLFDNYFNKNLKLYVYILHNYWYHVINKEILETKKVNELKNSIGNSISNLILNKENIYTTNFDNLLDETLKPKYLHGKFCIPFENVENIILSYYDDDYFEFNYLFGTNGFEKLSRLSKINNLKQNIYNLSFFYDKELVLNNLLIYGLSFGKAEMLSEEFINAYPQHKDNNLVKTVDGHILLKLIQMFKENRLDEITISYYSENDLINYNDIFENTELKNIITYKKCEEIFNFL